MIMRERNRMMNVLARNEEPELRVFSQALMRLEEESTKTIANDYYLSCCNNYNDEFFTWRDEVNKLNSEKMHDLNDGYSYPFLQSRIVDSFQFVDYEVRWHRQFKGAD
jgi:hypothetical protein